MTSRDLPDRPETGAGFAADDLSVAAVVHDVNQMLAVVTGRTGHLLDRVTDPELKRHLRAILLASGDAAAILQRLGGGPPRAGLDRDGVSPRNEAEQARSLAWPAGESRYVWANDIAEGLGVGVPAQVLREVLTNLLLNALAAMLDGGRITMSAREESGRVLIQVTDDGPGLPVADPELLFLSGVSGSGRMGRGIGLAGCRQLLAAFDGRLTAATLAGGGAVFSLDLPPGRIARRNVEPGSRQDARVPVPPMDVLIVDDEAGVRDMLQEVIVDWGSRVRLCRDAQMAQAEYRPGSAAVALIDRNLPGLSGLELASRLRVGDPCLSIVIMTGWQAGDDLGAAGPGVVDLKARKPVTLERLRDILNVGYQLNQSRRAAAARE
jgi:CheY-like chemotaxis protein